MRKIFRLAVLAFAVLSFASCAKEEADVQSALPVTPNNISGTWQLTEWKGAPIAEGSFVYMEIVRKDCLFTMYQNMDSFSTRKITGKYSIDDNDVISGVYDHYAGDWDNSYVISELSADRMVWTVVGDPEDVSVYTRIDALPDGIE